MCWDEYAASTSAESQPSLKVSSVAGSRSVENGAKC